MIRHGGRGCLFSKRTCRPACSPAIPARINPTSCCKKTIHRIYDWHVGYWQADLQGADYVSRADRGALLVDYLGVSESHMLRAAKRMIADGDYELAVEALDEEEIGS